MRTAPDLRRAFHDEVLRKIRRLICVTPDVIFAEKSSSDTCGAPFLPERIDGFTIAGSISKRISIHSRMKFLGIKVSWAGYSVCGFVELDILNDRQEYFLNFRYNVCDLPPPVSLHDINFDFHHSRFIPIESKTTTPEQRRTLHDKAISFLREKTGIGSDTKFEITKSTESAENTPGDSLGFSVVGVISRHVCRYDRVVVSMPLARWGAQSWDADESGAFVLLFITNRSEYSLQFTYVPADTIQPFASSGLRFEDGELGVTPADAFDV
jgi:hypothetical protein